MKRSISVALALCIVHSSTALAAESLTASAERVVRDSNTRPVAVASKPDARASFRVATIADSVGVRETPLKAEPLAQAPPGQGGAVSTGGMGKRTKWMIYLGAAAAFVATAYAIDNGVKDVTPSTLGTRED